MFVVNLFDKILRDRAGIAMCVENNYGKQVFVDSFYNSNINSNKLNLGLINVSEGKKVVKGFILEEYFIKKEINDSIIKVSKSVYKMYFREPIYVLDKRELNN